MFFSKSFGYALRGVLYVSAMDADRKKVVSIDEIAETLKVPKYFLGKIMNKVVKAQVLDSSKGHRGGFFTNQATLSTPLLRLLEITEPENLFLTCVLKVKVCDATNPCPLHSRIEEIKNNFYKVFSTNTVGDLLMAGKEELVRSICTY